MKYKLKYSQDIIHHHIDCQSIQTLVKHRTGKAVINLCLFVIIINNHIIFKVNFKFERSNSSMDVIRLMRNIFSFTYQLRFFEYKFSISHKVEKGQNL